MFYAFGELHENLHYWIEPTLSLPALQVQSKNVNICKIKMSKYKGIGNWKANIKCVYDLTWEGQTECERKSTVAKFWNSCYVTMQGKKIQMQLQIQSVSFFQIGSTFLWRLQINVSQKKIWCEFFQFTKFVINFVIRNYKTFFPRSWPHHLYFWEKVKDIYFALEALMISALNVLPNKWWKEIRKTIWTTWTLPVMIQIQMQTQKQEWKKIPCEVIFCQIK